MATILVADDDPITQRLVAFMLTKLGHRVLRAANGLEALAEVEHSSPDLVILDLAMPEMGGLAALRHLRGDTRFRDLPVIVLTASGLERDERAAQAEGVNDFLTKPFRSQELVEKLEHLLR
jgi:CheY-like chemotaxis protein